MNSAYAMRININRAFEKYGWCAKSRGIKSGGLVDHLSKFIGLTGNPAEDMELPVEIAISDHREAEISSCGFIPLCFCKNTDYAVFLGGQTVNSPRVYDNPNASANAQLSSRLPYLFAVSRFAHYVKCIVRDKLGSFESKEDMTIWLSDWSSEYVTTDPNADEDIKARYPLAEAKVSIDDIENQPGYYNVKFYLKPHYQLEGLTTILCLTTKVPRPASQ
jgi:type VI secretion system protein ImpC